jgi:hypothetical protein
VVHAVSDSRQRRLKRRMPAPPRFTLQEYAAGRAGDLLGQP